MGIIHSDTVASVAAFIDVVRHFTDQQRATVGASTYRRAYPRGLRLTTSRRLAGVKLTTKHHEAMTQDWSEQGSQNVGL